jgi:hypothetical protein
MDWLGSSKKLSLSAEDDKHLRPQNKVCVVQIRFRKPGCLTKNREYNVPVIHLQT